MPQKWKREEELGQCPRNVKGQKSWGNAPEIEKRQMIGNEEENAPVSADFQFFRISIFVRGGEDLKTTFFDYME